MCCILGQSTGAGPMHWFGAILTGGRLGPCADILTCVWSNGGNTSFCSGNSSMCIFFIVANCSSLCCLCWGVKFSSGTLTPCNEGCIFLLVTEGLVGPPISKFWLDIAADWGLTA